MPFVENLVNSGLFQNFMIPIMKGIFIVGFFVAWLLAAIFLVSKYVLTKERRFWIKYHVFKKKYDEESVQWCLDAFEKGYRNNFEVRKILLAQGELSEKKIEEMLFIFSEVKLLKGYGLQMKKIELTKINDKDIHRAEKEVD
jgi:hypothetical protein